MQGFEEMIKRDSKLIFVLLPGIKEYIKQHSSNDKSFRLVQAAIKVSVSEIYSVHLLSNARSHLSVAKRSKAERSNRSHKLHQAAA